jgi:uncharacterized protein YceK|tara:strand:- start:277 stop:615 length:339 start_codon:yes stop_codon:yes gene_type:complete
MVKIIVILSALTILISGCGKIPLGLLSGGGGPNVAANTQIGKENTQNLGIVTSVLPEIKIEAPVESVVQDTSTTKITEVDPLMLLLLVLGWIAPSPNEISRWVRSLFTRRKD